MFPGVQSGDVIVQPMEAMQGLQLAEQVPGPGWEQLAQGLPMQEPLPAGK